MLKEVQNTNQQISETLRTLKRQNEEAMKSQAKAQNQLYAAEREKSQFSLTLQKMQEQLQQIQHQRDHLAALLESERKDHKETGPLSTAVQQLSLIILNKSRRPGDMKPEERALVKEIFDQNIQSLLKECEDKLRKSQANERILSQTLKTHVSNSTNYLSDISNLASQVQKLGKTLQKFGASDLPVEIAMLRDELVQQRAEMRSKAAFADQEVKELEIEFKHLNAGLIQDQLGQAMFEGSDSIKSGDQFDDPDGLSLRIKELISKNQGETALLSQNKRLATDVEQLQKEVERLNSEQMNLMERNVSLVSKQTDTAKLKQQLQQFKSDKGEIQRERNLLKDKLQNALSTNQDLKILISKMEQERIQEKRMSPHSADLQKIHSSPDRAVGFFPANQGDPSPFRRETFGFEGTGPIDLSSVAGKEKQLNLSKQLNEASIVQLNLNLSQGQSVGVNESDNELLQLLHCQCSAMEQILQRRKVNASSSPVMSKHSAES